MFDYCITTSVIIIIIPSKRSLFHHYSHDFPRMSAALATYRRLITLAKRLPEPDAKNAITQIREAFRANKSVDSEERCVLCAVW